MSTIPTLPDLLDAAAALLTDPGHWTQGAFARTATGRGCDPQDPEAVRWCLLGAGWKVLAGTDLPPGAQSLLIQNMRSWLYATITTAPNPIWFSDNPTHADILAALRQCAAIVRAEEQEPPDATTEPADDGAASHPV